MLEWVEKVRSWIPAWRRAVRVVAEEAARPTVTSDPTALEHAINAATRFWAPTDEHASEATWSPHRAFVEALERDEAAQTLVTDGGAANSVNRDTHAELYHDLVSTALVGEHVQHLTINLQEAAASWPKAAPSPPGPQARPRHAAKARNRSNEEDCWSKNVLADAQFALDALQRALQHALFLTFVRDAARALPGERRDLFDYCDGWDLSDRQVEDIWGWLTHDSPHFGSRQVELAVDRLDRCVYRKPATLWQKTYTLTAPLWGGALAFGLVAGTFALLERAGLTTWPDDWPVKMVVLFLFVSAGGGLHLASRSLSNIRFSDPLKVYTAAEGWDWLRLRWLAILRIYLPIAVVVGVLWGAGNIPASFDEIGTAVLAGFTADSIFRTSLSAMQAQADAADPPDAPKKSPVSSRPRATRQRAAHRRPRPAPH